MSESRTGYISASQVEWFLKCPLAYKYVYVDGCDKVPQTIYMLFGKAIHKALEVNYRQKITSRKDLPIQEFYATFRAYIESELPITQPVDPIMCENIIMQGEALLHMYQEKIGQHLQPLLVEEKFEIELKTFGITIFGYIDLITEDGWIVDHKTVGTTTWQKRTQQYVNNLPQLSMYSLAYRKMFNKPERGLRIDLLKRLKENVNVATLLTQRQDLDVVVVAQLMKRMQQITHADLWYPNLQNCQTCDFKASCSKLCIL